MLHSREAFPKSFHNIPSLHIVKLIFCFQVINSALIEFGLLEKKRGFSYYKNAFILRFSLEDSGHSYPLCMKLPMFVFFDNRLAVNLII